MYPLLNRKSKLSVQNKLNIKTIIRPVLTYACPVWSFMTLSNFNKLQVVQNKFLRMIGNYRMFTPIFQMHSDLNIETTHDYVKKCSTSYFNRISSHSNNLVNCIPYENGITKHRRIMHIVYNT